MRVRSDRTLRLGSSLAIAACCAAGYLALLPAASGSHAPSARCGPRNAQTVTGDRIARVYRVPTGHGVLGTLYDYYGCAAGHGFSRLLARSASELPGRVVFSGCEGHGCREVRRIRLVGATVGVIVDQPGLDTFDSALTVRDLARGRVLHTVQAHVVINYGDSLITYVLAPSGNIAWAIDTTSSGPHGNLRHVGSIRSAIGPTVTTLDSGPSVRPKSLRLSGDTVEWIDSGQQRTAPLS